MFLEMAAKYRIPIHPRRVAHPRCPSSCPRTECARSCAVATTLSQFLPAHRSCGLPSPARRWPPGRRRHHYAKLCRSAGILTSLDGGGLRSNTHELLAYIDVAIVATRLCEQMKLTPAEMLSYLTSRGCRVGGVTMGERGLLWYDETGTVRSLAALPLPPRRSWTPAEPATSFMAPICIPISRIRPGIGRAISGLPGRLPPTRSGAWEMKQACRPSPTSRASATALAIRPDRCAEMPASAAKLVPQTGCSIQCISWSSTCANL